MSKQYNTKAKLLRPIYQPKIKAEKKSRQEPETKRQRRKKLETAWNPFDQRFYELDNTDDEDVQPRTRTPLTETSEENDVVHFEINDHEFEWDYSPEQVQLLDQSDSDIETIFQEAMQPKQLFNEANEGPQRHRALPRRNAMRRKKKPLVRSVSYDKLNEMENTIDIGRQIRSTPTSPSKVQTNEVNNLNLVLQPNIPLIPETVQLGTNVQRLHHALNHVETSAIRRSTRIQAKTEENGLRIDYKKMHKYGNEGGRT